MTIATEPATMPATSASVQSGTSDRSRFVSGFRTVLWATSAMAMRPRCRCCAGFPIAPERQETAGLQPPAEEGAPRPADRQRRGDRLPREASVARAGEDQPPAFEEMRGEEQAADRCKPYPAAL